MAVVHALCLLQFQVIYRQVTWLIWWSMCFCCTSVKCCDYCQACYSCKAVTTLWQAVLKFEGVCEILGSLWPMATSSLLRMMKKKEHSCLIRNEWMYGLSLANSPKGKKHLRVSKILPQVRYRLMPLGFFFPFKQKCIMQKWNAFLYDPTLIAQAREKNPKV